MTNYHDYVHDYVWSEVAWDTGNNPKGMLKEAGLRNGTREITHCHATNNLKSSTLFSRSTGIFYMYASEIYCHLNAKRLSKESEQGSYLGKNQGTIGRHEHVCTGGERLSTFYDSSNKQLWVSRRYLMKR